MGTGNFFIPHETRVLFPLLFSVSFFFFSHLASGSFHTYVQCLVSTQLKTQGCSYRCPVLFCLVTCPVDSRCFGFLTLTALSPAQGDSQAVLDFPFPVPNLETLSRLKARAVPELTLFVSHLSRITVPGGLMTKVL